MAIPWNEDDPRDAAVIVRNLTQVLTGIAQQALFRPPPTVAMAQEWHRRALVPDQLAAFEVAMDRAVAVLDSAIPAGGSPVDAAQLRAVLTLCGHAHGEWVRIHPFANGNGRTARLWANWCALRYGLPPFVRLKPRPEGDLYATAAALSMRGEHQAMVAVFADMLDRHLAA